MTTPATRLRTALATIAWSQSYLADRLGVSPATVRRWCSGAYEPDARVLSWLETLAAAHAAAPGPEGWE